MESEYLFLLVAAAQHAQAHQEYLDNTRSSYDKTKCRERKYDGTIVQSNPKTTLQNLERVHRSGDNLAKRLSTRSLISLHQSIGYEGGGNLLSTKPTSTQALDGFLRGVNAVELDEYFPLR